MCGGVSECEYMCMGMCNMRVKYETMCTYMYMRTYVCTSAPVVPGFLFFGLGPPALPCPAAS